MKSSTRVIVIASCVALVLSISGCGGGSSPVLPPPPHVSGWTWISGANTAGQSGVYGTQGTASPSNVPGARHIGVSWIDKSSNFWLFGGDGRDSTGSFGHLNDLWKFDGNNWTWVSGANTASQVGVYGTRGTASSSNVPGARNFPISWSDGNGNLWLFGGGGRDSAGTSGGLNDLWKFDGSAWTWVSGANTVNQAGVYGTQGTAAPSNVPGARVGAISWTDSGGNLWLFGGRAFDSFGTFGHINDLWKFDGSNWTWVSGANTINQPGVYGTVGAASPSNIPGARQLSATWIDKNGNLWLFGGDAFDSTGTNNSLNDLWKFDGTNWTWVSGANTVNQAGVYGAKGTTATSNVPGAR